MRIFFLGNNWLAWKVACWLKEQGETVVGVATHPPDRRRFGEDIISAAEVPPSAVFDGSCLRQREVMENIDKLGADLALSVLFGYILRPQFIGLFRQGVINVHPSYLPYNRGAYPNVWSIVEGTPAGATIHYIDSGVDTGDVIAQRRVEVEPVDSGETLYHKLERACLELFVDTWPLIRQQQAPRIPQQWSEGTYHQSEDVAHIDEIPLDRSYTARELIDILRARTYPPYPGAYFRANGRKVYIRAQLLYEEDLLKETDVSRI